MGGVATRGSTNGADSAIVCGMELQLPKTPFLSAYHELFNSDDLWSAARRLGAVSRQRKVDLPALVEASVLALSGLPGTQTTIYANYVELVGQTLAPSAFYDRFTKPYADLLRELAGRAVAAVRAVDDKEPALAELGGLLDHFSDVRVADSSCQVLRKLAAAWAPSTSKERPASFKLHAVVSLKDLLPVEEHLSPQRDHDSPQLDIRALVPGTLFMADLGYIDHGRLLYLVDKDVQVLMRLKESEDPRIERVRIGRGSRRACRGMRLNEALGSYALDFKDGVLDIDVRIEAEGPDGQHRSKLLRVVGLVDPERFEARLYLTSVSTEILTPTEVALCYTMRWDIELLWKHLKTGAGLTAIRAWREAAVTALVYAKIIAVALSRLLELTVRQSCRDHAMGQLAILLTLNRMVPMLMAWRLQQRGVSLEEMERRILLLAAQAGRSRQQRRERKRRELRASLGKSP